MVRGTFFGLNVALRGLYSAQRNLDVINHNINNVNTPGFSRQRAVQVASTPVALLDGTGMIGTGSEVVSIERVRDEYIDFKYWSENIAYGEWMAKREVLADMEAMFNEPSESGFTAVMNEFFNSLQELSKDPSSQAVRALVKEKGVTLAKYFNSMAEHLEKLQADINYRIKTKVEEVNALATQIVELNRQIYIAELDGNVANDLRDRRTVLVDRMSKIINVEANEVVTGKLPDGRDDKHFVLTISGKAIVDHFSICKLDLIQRDESMKLNEEDIPNLYEIRWQDGNKIKITGGELRGYLDMRDGNEGQIGLDNITYSPMYKGIPYYIKKLNQFVRTFAMAFNEGYLDSNTDFVIDPSEDGAGHVDGYRLGSVPGDSPSGVRFFTMLGDGRLPMDSSSFIGGAATISEICDAYAKLTAKNFAVSLDIMNDINSISTSDTAGQEGNINILNSILAMRHNSRMFSEGAPEDFMKSLVATLGIDSQQAVRYAENQDSIIKQLENRRLSNSGVSPDEEMANMVKYQHAYNAAARMIVTMSEIYETLINELGRG